MQHRILTAPQLSQLGHFSDASQSAPPSRATWFLLGMVAAWLGPTLLGLGHAAGRRATKAIDA